MNKLPVFLHIPKSGGTYVLSWAISMFRLWTHGKELQHEDSVISVKQNDLIVLTVLAYIPDRTNFIFHSADEWNIEISLDAFLIELSKAEINIFFIMIEPAGFFILKDKIIESMNDLIKKTPVYCMTMRDSFLRCQSLYNYLKSETSSHEASHGSIKSKTFQDYLHSEELEDSWSIRRLMGVSDNEQITKEHFDNACNILDNIKIVDINDVDSLIDEMFNECHSITRQDVFPYQIILNRNETNMPKIDFFGLDDETQRIFLKRTEFDRKIYDRYIK